MKFFQVSAVSSALVLVFLLGLSGCCDCPSYYSGILKVRLLNGGSSGIHVVHFEVMPAGRDNVVASGDFLTDYELSEAYAMLDGKTHIFMTSDNIYDIHVYIDEDDSLDYSSGDTEAWVKDVLIIGETLQEVDYSVDFTTVE